MLPPKLKESARQVVLLMYANESNDVLIDFVDRMISSAREKLKTDFSKWASGNRILGIAVEMHLFMASIGAEMLTDRGSTEEENKSDQRDFLIDLTKELQEFCKQ